MSAVCLLAVIPASALAVDSAAQDEEYFEASVRQLQMTVQPQRDGSHLQRLFALRRLADPSLDPLFYQLIRHGEWQVQVHAVLGLAENSESRRVDPWLIMQLKPDGQDAAIATSLDLDLMGEAEIRELMDWDGLLPMSRLLMAAELVLQDLEPPLDALRQLSENPDMRIAGLASALLLETDSNSEFSRFRDKLATLALQERQRILSWLFEVFRQYELESVGPWLISELESTEHVLDERLLHEGLFAALEIAPSDAEPLMRRIFEREMRLSTRVRLMQMLLSTRPAEPMWAFELLSAESPLLNAMKSLGRAQLDGAPLVSPIKALIDIGHPRSMQWAVEYATQRMTPEDAIVIFNHVIDRSNTVGDVSAGLVIAAATELYELAPESLLDRLMTVDDDSVMQEMLLLAILDVHDERAAAAASSLRRIGAGRADVLALMLIACGSSELNPADMRRLGLIASGGGRVAEALQVQAAWLYLKRIDRVDAALARAFE